MKKLMLITAITLASCAQEKASFETIEKNRKTAIENAEFNAKQFRLKNPNFQQWGLISDGDSTISPTCPQGDGWATLSLVGNDGRTVKIKCSTYSPNIQCLTAADFKTKSYAAQDGICNRDVPNPLPKIVK